MNAHSHSPVAPELAPWLRAVAASAFVISCGDPGTPNTNSSGTPTDGTADGSAASTTGTGPVNGNDNSTGAGIGTDGDGSMGTTSGAALTSSTGGATATTGGDQLSFAASVAPLLKGRCTDCHHRGVTAIPNIADPFEPVNGLLAFANTWVESYPDTPAMNVSPGDPDNSFIMNKISDPAVQAGEFMPWSPERLTSDEIQAVRQWVSDGAANNAFYEANIRPIFGTAGALGAPGGKCNYCHYPGGLVPNLSDPFDPINGAVGVRASQPGWTRVIPGDPDNSLLVVKIEATVHGDSYGAPMPMVYEPMTTEEVEIVRRWIAEGAQNN